MAKENGDTQPAHEVLLHDLRNVEYPAELLQLLSQIQRMKIPKGHNELDDAVLFAEEEVVSKISQVVLATRTKLLNEKQRQDEEAAAKAKAADDSEGTRYTPSVDGGASAEL